jgi:protein-S-isoprenylcysteine O-methyltransferase Ste14
LPLGEPLPDHARPLGWAIPANIALFGVFALHHSLLARERAKRILTRAIPRSLERSFYVWVASALLVAILLAWQFVEGLVYWVEGPARWIFHFVQLAGVHLTLRGAAAVDPLELAGIRPPPNTNQAVFHTSGVFGLVRHPIYLGWILMTFFAPKLTINRLIFAVISTAYLLIAIPWEERSLVATYGDRYREYQSRVRWRLIPGVW